MKTVVVFKWTRNPQDAIVKNDGSVTWTGVKMTATDDDPAAMNIALALSSEEDIQGLTVGDGKPEWAAARGAASTIVVEDIASLADGSVAADAIAAAIKRLDSVDVVTIGDSDWDRAVVSALVGKLGWKAYAGVIDAKEVDGSLHITVKSPDGSKVIKTDTPVLLAAQSLSQEENAPGMKQTLAARKKPLEKISSQDLETTSHAKAQVLKTRLPEGEAAILFDGSNPEEAVAQLIKALQGEGVL